MSAAAIHKCAVKSGPAMIGKLRGRHCAGGNQPDIVASVVRLAEDQPRLLVVAPNKEDIDAYGLHLRDQRAE